MMPCGDNAHPTSAELEIDRLEKMLCGLCRRVETQRIAAGHGHILIEQDPTLVAWWAHHRAIDDRKRAMEAQEESRRKLAKRAKAKLTPQELEALGIRD